MALLLWVLPQSFGKLADFGPGMYLQHVGCVSKSADHLYEYSNSTLAPLMNFITFNFGYHTNHHEYPQVLDSTPASAWRSLLMLWELIGFIA